MKKLLIFAMSLAFYGYSLAQQVSLSGPTWSQPAVTIPGETLEFCVILTSPSGANQPYKVIFTPPAGGTSWDASSFRLDGSWPGSNLTAADFTTTTIGQSFQAEIATMSPLASGQLCVSTDHDGASPTLTGLANLAPGEDAPTMTIAFETALALKLTDFDVKPNGFDAVLRWKSLTAEDNQLGSYTVQRSLDGKNYVSIGSLKVPTNRSASINQYDFVDSSVGIDNPNMMIYYRLKKEDNDGTSEISEVKSLSFRQIDDIKIFPTATSSVINVLTPSSLERSQYTIVDTNGKEVVKNDLIDHKIDVSQLSVGRYTFVITSKNSGKNLFTKKFYKN